MSRTYPDRRDRAKQDAAELLGKHVMKEEPVRSFRFHSHYVDKKCSPAPRVEHRPGFVTFLPPAESVKFLYTSTYCFTLTWTPGHMTIVGDIGELTVVHYHAMPTLEAACNWLQSPDYAYLLSKTNEARRYDAGQTFDWFKRMLSEQVLDHALGTPGWSSKQRRDNGDVHELRAWRKYPPKWNKRAGMTRAEFDQERRWYVEDKPKSPFTDHERDCWQWWRKLAEYTGYGPEDVCRAKYRRRMLDRVKDKFEHEQLAADFLWRDMGYDDPSLAYEYRQNAFFQIAAIQHGARMILNSLVEGRRIAA